MNSRLKPVKYKYIYTVIVTSKTRKREFQRIEHALRTKAKINEPYLVNCPIAHCFQSWIVADLTQWMIYNRIGKVFRFFSLSLSPSPSLHSILSNCFLLLMQDWCNNPDRYIEYHWSIYKKSVFFSFLFQRWSEKMQ